MIFERPFYAPNRDSNLVEFSIKLRINGYDFRFVDVFSSYDEVKSRFDRMMDVATEEFKRLFDEIHREESPLGAEDTWKP